MPCSSLGAVVLQIARSPNCILKLTVRLNTSDAFVISLKIGPSTIQSTLADGIKYVERQEDNEEVRRTMRDRRNNVMELSLEGKQALPKSGGGEFIVARCGNNRED